MAQVAAFTGVGVEPADQDARLGNAELENLPDIFARVGGNAKAANFNLDQTLALVELLSKSEPQAERLATLVDSTMRVFTNMRYMKEAQKATGIGFYDERQAPRSDCRFPRHPPRIHEADYRSAA